MENGYFLFGGEYYYPSGGVKDLMFCAHTLLAALDHLNNGNHGWIEWFHIINIKTAQVVAASIDSAFPEFLDDRCCVEYKYKSPKWGPA